MDRIQMQPPVEKYANPNTCLFNVLFKARALAFYILSALFFNSFVIIFVVTVFLAALDFFWWTIYLTTKRTMESSIPYVVLGVLYAYLLYLSWSPDTLRSMFVSKYWLPKLPGIRRMFSNKMTVASAWIHLLAVDLFARCCCEWENSKDDIFEMIIQFTF